MPDATMANAARAAARDEAVMMLDRIASDMRRAGPFGATKLAYKHRFRDMGRFERCDTAISPVLRFADTMGRLEMSLTGQGTARTVKLAGKLASEWDGLLGMGADGMLSAVAAKLESYKADIAKEELLKSNMLVMSADRLDMVVNQGRRDIVVGMLRGGGRAVSSVPPEFKSAGAMVAEKEMIAAMLMQSGEREGVERTLADLLRKGFFSPDEYAAIDTARMRRMAQILLAVPRERVEGRRLAIEEARRMLTAMDDKAANSIVIGLIERGLAQGGFQDSLDRTVAKISERMTKSMEGYMVAGASDSAGAMADAMRELAVLRGQAEAYGAAKSAARSELERNGYDGSRTKVPSSILARY